MALIGKVAWIKGLFLAIGQVLGAVVASILVKLIFPGTYVVQTKLGHGASAFQGFLIETVLTMQLMLAIYFMAVEKHEGNALAALVIGFALFVAEYVASSSCSRVQRTCADCGTIQAARHLLHRRLSQPRQDLRSGSRHARLREHPLDLLAGSSSR